MTRLALAALLALTILSSPALAGDAPAAVTPSAAPAPRISFALKEIDFGQAVQGEPVIRTFKYKNVGTAPLTVRRVKPSCGCTAALAAKTDLAPGEESEIQVRMETADRQGFQAVEIHVFHNDDLEQDLGEKSGGNLTVLRLRGEITQLVSIMPMSLYYESLERGTACERRVTVLPTDRAEIHALSVVSPKPWLLARTEAWKRGAKTGFEVIVTVLKDAPIGKIDDPILVTTDNPRQKVLRIPAFGQIHGKLVAFPERLEMFPMGDYKEKVPTIFLMRIAEGTGLAIDGIETPPEITAEPLEVVPGKRAEIVLKIRPDARPGPFTGMIRIFLRDADQPLFEIPVLGAVPRKVTLDPPAVWLEGPTATARVKVSGAKILGVSVEGSEKGPAAVTAAFESKDAGSGLISISGASTASPGPFRAKLVIRTDAPGEETVEVPIRGVIEARK